jgi:hypothetical protein
VQLSVPAHRSAKIVGPAAQSVAAFKPVATFITFVGSRAPSHDRAAALGGQTHRQS